MPHSPKFTRTPTLLSVFVLAATCLASSLAVLLAPAVADAEAGIGAVSWGDNSFMELGSGYRNGQEEQPVTVVGLNNIKSVKLGYHFNVALLGDGTVRTWGGNGFGQLGNKTHLIDGTPTNIGVHGATAIAVGGAHALALLENGTVANWGANEFGELGNGLLNPMKRVNARGVLEATMQGSGRQEPVAVPGLVNVVAVAAGNGSEFALLANGTVIAWGKNDRGQLGNGTIGPQLCKTEIGEVECNTKPEPVLLPNHEPLRGVKAIAAGSEAAYALLTNGHVMAWGNNGRGQLGNGSTNNSSVAAEVKNLSNVVSVTAGAPYAIAQLSNGSAVGWGGNDQHQLGMQVNESCQLEPCVKLPKPIPGLEGATSISAGRAFTLAVIRGKVWALGDNEPWGQLGIGGALSGFVARPIEGLPPVAFATAGEQHAVAVLQSGSTPVPKLTVTPGANSLGVAWTVNAPVQALRWRVFNTYTEGGGPWSPMTAFHEPCTETAPCKYTISGLPAVPIEVELLSYTTTDGLVTRRAVATP